MDDILARTLQAGKRFQRIALIFVALLVAAALVLLWQPSWLVAALARRSPDVLYFASTSEPMAALTIDDGPDPETTPEILRVLAAHQARATFFLISSRIPGNETLVSEIVAQGHELGNHLVEDETSIRMPPDQFEAALLEAHGVLSRFGPVRWMRPSGGWYNDTMLAVARARGYRVALGSVYPYDAHLPFVPFIVFHLVRRSAPGSVIVLHDGGARGRRTAEVLTRVLPAMARNGLRLGTLSELVERRVAPPPAGRLREQPPAASRPDRGRRPWPPE